MSQVWRTSSRDLRISLEKSNADKTQISVRRMFGATSSYVVRLVLQLVDDQNLCGPTHAEQVNLKQG